MAVTTRSARSEWARSAAIGACVALAITVMWAAWQTWIEAPALAASPGGDRTHQAADRERRAVGQHIGWLVSGSRVMEVGETTRACLAAGPQCTTDGMLDVDTTSIRAGSLGEALSEAISPTAGGYLGRPTAATIALTRATAAAATTVGQLLRQWLTTGCGPSVDGIVVTTHPPSCDRITVQATQAMTDLEASLRSWSGP